MAIKNLLPVDLPRNCILGINYSGMHDTAISLVSPTGTPLFCVSLERLSRVKQDGRPPHELLASLPWTHIDTIAITTDQHSYTPVYIESSILSTKLPKPRVYGLEHAPAFQEFVDALPGKKMYVCHQMAHAASAFWGSQFSESICLTYDGGMCNSPWFGGLFICHEARGIQPIERFNANHYAKITSLYSMVTALLGFTPNKHEGKITGLAAYGSPSFRALKLLNKWFEQDYFEMEETMRWFFSYQSDVSAILFPNLRRLTRFKEELADITPAELAASLQDYTEQHVLNIIKKAHSARWGHPNICLAGGLFANVKLNQRIAEAGFKSVFVAPPMTDEGTSLGAAWYVASKLPTFKRKELHSMYLGPVYPIFNTQATLKKANIRVHRDSSIGHIVKLLSEGAIVALFQGRSEFGPRALGNRSIIGQATVHDINTSLNTRLNRTEFMPFAPITRDEDAELCYINIDAVRHAAEFMTVTVNCTEFMQQSCPAVVHKDGTARPQLVHKETNPFLHQILTCYRECTGLPALINTSFNIHEEPIVESIDDALRAFFVSGLDYLYVENFGLISFVENPEAAIRYLSEQTKLPSQKAECYKAINDIIAVDLDESHEALVEKERVITVLKESKSYLEALKKHYAYQKLNASRLKKRIKDKMFKTIRDSFPYKLLKKLKIISLIRFSLHYKDKVITKFKALLRPVKRVIKPLFVNSVTKQLYQLIASALKPRIGKLYQHKPKPLVVPKHYESNNKLSSNNPLPKISIVTPSFGTASFIKRTLDSVLNQNYPNLEYFVQDGGSKDGTIDILQGCADKLSGWVSEKDGGQSNAINLGFQRTTGDIMAWLNSDDILLPG
ncbi:MAG: carbamoyltransferase C-terminal domain-containing protein, partial [Pseudomonadota bacterium]